MHRSCIVSLHAHMHNLHHIYFEIEIFIFLLCAPRHQKW